MSKIFNKDKVEMILMGPAVAREKNILSVIPLQCFCFINYFNIKYLSPKFETWVGKRLFSNVKVKQYNKQTMQLFVPRESETTGGGWGGVGTGSLRVSIRLTPLGKQKITEPLNGFLQNRSFVEGYLLTDAPF